MTTYSAIANSEIAVGAPITNSLMTKLRDNPLAIQEGDATASSVRIQYAALAAAVQGQLVTNGDSHDHNGVDGAQIPSGGIAAAAITRAKLSTTTGSTSGNSQDVDISLAAYSFFPDIEMVDGSGQSYVRPRASGITAAADSPQIRLYNNFGSVNYSVAWRYVQA